MSTFLVVLFALLVPALFILFIWFLIAPMSSSYKPWLIAIAIIGLILCEGLFILAARIPSNADKLIETSIAGMEEHINQINPDYVNKELPTADIQNILKDTKMLDSYIDDAPNARLVVRLIGAGAYIQYVTSFSKSIDANIEEMKAEGIPVTIHTVFERIHQKSEAPILKATKILEIIVLVITGILLLALLIVWAYLKKDAAYLDSPRVTVIEPSDEIETGHNRPRGE